jgi:PAS domain S-box-containing protein
MLHVLYVDDEPGLLEIGKLFLEQSRQFSVDIITSAPAALTLLNTKNFDAIICDYQMPEMNGIEFLKKVRNSGNSIPFILFTGRGREEIVIQALNEGVDFYLQKGGDPRSQFAELQNMICKSINQKKADAALKTSEEQYRSLVDNLNVGIYRNTAELPGRWLWANQAFLKMFGYDSLENFLSRPVTDIYINAEDHRQYIQAIQNQGFVKDYELNLKQQDGTPIWVAANARVKRNEAGEIAWIDGICDDITSRKKTEDSLRAAYEQITGTEEELRTQYEELRDIETALRNSERKLQGIVYGSPIPQFVIDKNHRVISWNSALEEYSGVRADEVIGTTDTWKAFYPEKRPVMADLLVDNAMDNIPTWYAGKYNQSKYIKAAFEATDFFPRMGEHGKWLYFTASPLRDAENTIIGAVETLEDITEIKEKEEALKVSEAKYRNILENIQDVYYRSDADGNLILASPSVATVLGYDPPDLYGKNIAQTIYYYPEQRTQFLADINRNGSVTNYEVTLKKRDGTPVSVSTSSHKYCDPSGNFLGVEGIFRDVTEQKKAEDELRKAYEQITAADEELHAQFDELKFGQDALSTSEKKLQGIVHGSPIPQFVIDKNHRVISWNHALEQYSGIKADEVLGTNQQWKAFYPEARPIMVDLLVDGTIDKIPDWYSGKYNKSKYVEGGYEATDFFPHMGKSGTWLYFTASTIKDSKGDIIGAVETLEDITERQNAEDELRRAYEQITAADEELRAQFDELKFGQDALITSEKKLQGIVHGSPIPQFVIDKNHRVISWNHALEQYSRIKADEVLGTNQQWKAFYPEARPIMADLLVDDTIDKIPEWYSGKYNKSKYVEGGYEATDFFPHMGKSGTWLYFTASTIKDSKGDIIGAVETLEDVTEIKENELMLKKSEELYRNVVNTQTEFICRFKPDGTHIFINEAYCRYFGKKCTDLIGKKFLPKIPAEDQKKVQEHFASLTKEKPVAMIDHRIIMPDGTLRWQRWVDRAIFDEHGVLIEYQTVGRDITDIKEVEAALRESEEQYSALFHKNHSVSILIDPDSGILVDANAAACAYYGYRYEQITRMGIFEINRLDREKVLRDLAQAKNQKEKHFHSTHYLATGEQRYVEIYSGPIKVKGKLLLYSIIHDVTDRKRTEQLLRDSENKLSAIVRGSPIPQFVIDKDHKVIQWNTALESYSGIKADEVISTNQQWRAFYTQERPCMADFLVEGQIEKIPQRYSDNYTKSPLIKDAYETIDFFPHMRKSGTWLRFTAAPIRDAQGAIIGAVETLEDITERKLAEEALRQTNKKLNLLSSITRHDILNQLTALKGYLQLSQQSEHDPEKTQGYVEKGLQAAITIEHQISFTRDYEEMGVKASTWQNVGGCVSRAVASLPMKGIVVHCNGTNIEVLADPLFEKVFYNLIDNALKYGGKKMSEIIVSFRIDNGDLVIACKDNGAGISVPDKKRLFERGLGKHTGLGLFLTKEILSITGITIKETGEHGKGAQFEITVPKGTFRFADPMSRI